MNSFALSPVPVASELIPETSASPQPVDHTLQLSVVVPTFCEAENLEALIRSVTESITEADLEAEIIVVDDNSPDSTRQVCEVLSKRYPLRLITRTTDRGLASAVVHGIRHARGEIIVVMDADLSHPPRKVPELFKMVSSGDADFALGSRYVPGGSVETGWGLFRWLNSKVATLLAWPLTAVRDPMAGFFAIRREVVCSAQNIDPIGYKIALELMVKCNSKRIREIPIHFSDRQRGESKLSIKEQFNYLRHLKRLYEFRLGAFARPMQFLLVGAIGSAVDLTCLAALGQITAFGVARAASIAIAMSFNFWLNRRLTYSYARANNPVMQYVRYCLSCLVGATLNWTVSMWVAGSVSPNRFAFLLAGVAGIGAGTIANYLLSTYFVFGHNHTSVDVKGRDSHER